VKTRTVTIIPTFNEPGKIERVLGRFVDGISDEIVIVDDGSDPPIERTLSGRGATILRHDRNRGVGAAIRTGLEYGAKNGFDIAVVMAGNGKDDPREIPKLLEPLKADQADYVAGSRFLPGGRSERLPLARFIAIKVYSWLYSRLVGTRVTDMTNGFRAYWLSLLKDSRIDLGQSWLDRYELEYYLFHKVLSLGYRVVEVPVSKIYPENSRNYTKVKPGLDWWRIIRPIVFLTLRIKQ